MLWHQSISSEFLNKIFSDHANKLKGWVFGQVNKICILLPLYMYVCYNWLSIENVRRNLSPFLSVLWHHSLSPIRAFYVCQLILTDISSEHQQRTGIQAVSAPCQSTSFHLLFFAKLAVTVSCIEALHGIVLIALLSFCPQYRIIHPLPQLALKHEKKLYNTHGSRYGCAQAVFAL